MKYVARLLLFIFVITAPAFVGCSKYQVQKRQEKQRRKELVKEQERRDLEAQAAYEEALERHYAMQTPQTKRAMRQNMKKSIALKENKKPCFIKRWFTPKQKKKPPRREG